jgi:hypothetical protein
MRLVGEQDLTRWRHERCYLELRLNDVPLFLWFLHMLDEGSNPPIVLILHCHEYHHYAP